MFLCSYFPTARQLTRSYLLNYRLNLIWTYTVNYIEKVKINNTRPGMAHFLKKIDVEKWHSKNFRHACFGISRNEILIVGGDVSGWILDISSETMRMTETSPTFLRQFALIERIDGGDDGDRLFVLGGDFFPEKVEEFRVNESRFEAVPVPLIRPRSRFGSVVVPKSIFRDFDCV